MSRRRMVGYAFSSKRRASTPPAGQTTAQLLAARSSSFVYGTTKPTAMNTGAIVQAGDVRTTISTDFTATANTTYDGYDFSNWVTVNVANVTFKNCRFYGPPNVTAGNGRPLLRAYGASVSNLVIEDSTFCPSTPNGNYYAGIDGHDYTIHRCDISACVDGLDVYNNNPNGYNTNSANTTIEGCYIHDLIYEYPDPAGVHSDGTHTDCIQVQGDTDIVIRGCNLQAFHSPTYSSTTNAGTYPIYSQANAAIMVKNTTGQISALTIDKNWIDGGGYSINIANGGVALGNIGTIQDNRFGTNSRVGRMISMPIEPYNASTVVSGNVIDATSAPLVQHIYATEVAWKAT